MNRVGTAEQLAALLVEGEDRVPGPSVSIYGTPGAWSVGVTDTEDEPVHLASTRRASVARTFKTLDAAHAAAIHVQRLAQPGPDVAFFSVRITMYTP